MRFSIKRMKAAKEARALESKTLDSELLEQVSGGAALALASPDVLGQISGGFVLSGCHPKNELIASQFQGF